MSRNAAKVQPGSKTHPASGSRSHEGKAAAQQPAPSVHPVEPEDAHLTGTSRSLQRRVLGLNVEDKQAQPHPEAVAGQHATGSFTGKDSTPKKRGA
jgi:hypothetical protein